MEHRVTSDGIETYGALTPWSDIVAITLVREGDVIHEGATIAQAHWMLVVDLATGDFLEIIEGNPSWATALDGLQQHCDLLVGNLTELISQAGVTETVLWRG